jgi:predicted metal-dependent peptidase
MSSLKKSTTDKTFIQQAIWNLLNQHAFLGNFLQELSIYLDDRVPTAALQYDKVTGKFRILLNEEYMREQTPEVRVGILLHELMHFTNGHVFRWDTVVDAKKQMMRNIAADMAINQYIQHLPEGCIDVKNYVQADGSPFPTFKTMEAYHELLENTTDDPNASDESEDGEGDGEGQGKGKGKPGSGQGKGRSANWEEVQKYKQFDEHDWDQLTDEEKRQMMQEAKELVQRSIDKTFKDYTLAPQGIKDFLEEIKSKINSMNYRGMLKYAIKKSLTSQDRANSWNRPSKRYGGYAPGTTNEKQPFINMYVDTSGSISIEEANAFLAVINGMLGAGHYKHCNIGFWHTALYNFRKYNRNSPLKKDDIECGGTDPLCVIDHIKKENPNLSLILTDGCYSKENIKVTQRVIWIISENGTVDHPYKDIGLTIKMSSLK